VWGREYRFDRSPLPVGIKSGDTELLAAPLRLVGQFDSASAESDSPTWAWDEQGVTIWEQSEGHITLGGYLANKAATVNATVRIDYDGFMRIDLAMLPPGDAITSNLWFELPMRPELATLRHHWPGVKETWPWNPGVKNSGTMPEEGMRLRFQPVVWIGNEEMGVSWCCESDEHWRPARKNAALEIMPEKEATILRARFFDSPLPQAVSQISFALQATPVKPWSNALHERNQCFNSFTGYPGYTGGVYDLKESELDTVASRGVKAFYIWNEWTPALGYWRAPADKEEALKDFVEECHQRGMEVIPYFGQFLSTQSPEFARFGTRMVNAMRDGIGMPYNAPAPQSLMYLNLNDAEWRETYLKGMIDAVERYGFDGVYLDGNLWTQPSTNQAAGCGYKDADGHLRPTYPIYASRDFFRRLYEELHPRGKWIDAHNSSYCGTANMSFVDSYWDGEQFGFDGSEESSLKRSDPLRHFPLDMFRAEFMGRNYGIPCEFLQDSPDHIVPTMALTLLHDVRVRPSTGPTLELIAPVWEAMERFGTTKARWYPYYKNGGLLRLDTDDVKASFWRSGEGNQSRLLMVATNFSTEPLDAKLELTDPAKPSLASATDALTGEKLAIEGSTISVTLPASAFRLIEVD